MSEKKSDLLFADYLRVIATFAVVQLHCTGGLLQSYDTTQPYKTDWLVGNAYYSMYRWAVPIFIMLSGSLLLKPKYEEDLKFFFKKRLWRVLRPFLFWSVIYLAYENRGFIRDMKMPEMRNIVQKFFFEDVYYHLWFIPMIISLYFLTPTFRIFIKHAQKIDVAYFLVVAFTVTCVQLFVPNFFVIKYIGWLGYIGFYVLGYYIRMWGLPYLRWWLVLGVLSIPFTAVMTQLQSGWNHKYSDLWYYYFSPNVVLMSMVLFEAVRVYDWRALGDKFPKLEKFVRWFAHVGFGVYFVHVLVIDLFKNRELGSFYVYYNSFLGTDISPVYGNFIFALTVTIISTLIIIVLDKIPWIKNWIR